MSKHPYVPPVNGEQEFDVGMDNNLKMTKNEMKGLIKAMESNEFKDIMGEYVQEISDPKNKAEQEQYLKQLEDQGELPPNTKLIKPQAGFCMKSITKKLMSKDDNKYFDQKCFINVCSHEIMDKPRQVEIVKNGQKGSTFELPYRVSQPRHDQDKKGDLVQTFDVIYHPEVLILGLHHGQKFHQFICDTALDGVNRVLGQDKERISKDYKVMKNLKCKGGEPASITVKIDTENPILNNLDTSKHETKLQKEITQINEDGKEVPQNVATIEEMEEEDSEDEEIRPTGITQPNHKIVYSYPVNMQQIWHLPGREDREDFNMPTSMKITIEVPWMESLGEAELDINSENLIFKVEKVYYLDISLKYIVDEDKGNAKYVKEKKQLTIDLPILDLTEKTKEEKQKEKEAYEKMQNSRSTMVYDLEEGELPVEVSGEHLKPVVDHQKLQDEAINEGEGENE